jgi:hypothetical protein
MNVERTQLLEEVESGQIKINQAADKFADLNNAEVDSGVTDIRTLLSAYDFKVLDDAQTQRIQRRLESQNEGTREEAKAEIIARANNVREYMTKLSTGDNVSLVDGSYESIFNKEGGSDQKQDYIDMFTSLSLSEQIDWMRKIDDDISNRIEQFNLLVELVGDNAREKEMGHFKTLRTKERKNYISRLKNADLEFEELTRSSKLSNGEKRDLREAFDELGLKGKLIEIDRLKKTLAPNPKSLEFEALSDKRKKKIKKFDSLSDAEKEEILVRIRSEIKSEYLDKLNSCPHFTREDLRLMRPTVRGRFDIKLAEDCLSYLDSTIDLATEAANEGSQYDKEVLDHFHWDNIGSLDRKALLSKGLLPEYQANLENIKLDKEYMAKLKQYESEGEFGLISSEAAKEYYEWFQELKLDHKQNIIKKSKNQRGLDKLEDTKHERRKLNKRFAALPDQIQKEYRKEFKEGGYTERTGLVYMLETETKKLDSKFKAKIEDMIAQDLLSPNSKKSYIKWYENLNLSEKIKYAESSDLDNKDRAKQRDLFKDKILELAPAPLRKKLKKTFEEANLKKRKALNRQWLKEFGDLDENEVNELVDIEENEQVETIPFETQLFLDHAKKAENKGDTNSALTFYKAILESDADIDEKTKKLVKDKIEELEIDLGNYDEEIESGHFNMHLEQQIGSLLETDSSLSRAQERLTIIEGLHQIKWRNEMLFKKQANTDEMMDATLNGESERVKELNEAMLEHTDDEKGIIKDSKGQLKVSEQKVFDAHTFTDNEQTYTKWRSYTAGMQAQQVDQRWDTSVVIIHPKSGQELSADQTKTQIVDKERERFINNGLSAKVYKRLGVDPKTASEKTIATIKKHLRERDYTKRIPRSSETARKSI